MASAVRLWLPLFRELKRQNFSLALARTLVVAECSEADLACIPALTDFLRASRLHAQIQADCHPGTALHGEALLDRVAGMVGLKLPKAHA